MDLASIDLQAAAEEGVEVKLQHPANGEYLVDDEGEHLTIVILGKDSQTWQNAAKRVNTRNANRYKDRKIPNAVLEAALYEILAEKHAQVEQEHRVRWCGIKMHQREREYAL